MRHETHCLQVSRAEQAVPARRMRLSRLLRGTIVAIAFALAAPMTASAHDTLNNDDSDNIYRGYVGKHGSRVVPWVRTIYIQGLQCARFQMESQHTDLEMVVIAPNPSRRYRNNDGPGIMTCGATCPIVRIAETEGFPGYYTIHVSPKDGAAVEGEFLLRVTIKPTPDAICDPATPAF